MPDYQAVLVLSFGGPEHRDDVIPFLENVLRGRNVPRERLLAVAEHYYHFGGKSPINDQNRELIAALEAEFRRCGLNLPVYWGNRNWRPLLDDTLRRMRADGVRRAAVYVTSAFSSYSGCRQYIEDMDRARAEVGQDAPELDKLPSFSSRPGFIATVAERVEDALARVPQERRSQAQLVFTAHSVPRAMAEASPYITQLHEACGLVAARLGKPEWTLAYQSRSGPPTQPWLEPDILPLLRRIREDRGPGADVVLSPIGFVSDHMEVLYDLDTEAAAVARELDLSLIRAATPGVHPLFIAMIREMVEERMAASGQYLCRDGCCPPGRRPAA
ncbi:MAG: ferrochelatase [Acidobacteria bacterium]|nr:ferrochelatase [Acidobacteriota bacterium]